MIATWHDIASAVLNLTVATYNWLTSYGEEGIG